MPYSDAEIESEINRGIGALPLANVRIAVRQMKALETIAELLYKIANTVHAVPPSAAGPVTVNFAAPTVPPVPVKIIGDGPAAPVQIVETVSETPQPPSAEAKWPEPHDNETRVARRRRGEP